MSFNKSGAGLIKDILQGVDRYLVDTNFVVDMGAGAFAGVAQKGDDLPSFNFLPRFDQDLLQVAVFGYPAISMVNDDQVAKMCFGCSIGNLAICS